MNTFREALIAVLAREYWARVRAMKWASEFGEEEAARLYRFETISTAAPKVKEDEVLARWRMKTGKASVPVEVRKRLIR